MRSSIIGHLLVVLALSFGAVALAGEDAPKEKQERTHKEGATGKTRGEVVEINREKGALVIRMENGETQRFLPRWIGGMPKDGGGLDKSVQEQVRKLIPGSIVEVAWKIEEGPRVVGVKVLKQAATSGTVQGTIVSIKKGVLTLETEDGRVVFTPHWRGGAPKDGGGFDKDTLAKLERLHAGDIVRVRWRWEERRRIEAIEKIGERREEVQEHREEVKDRRDDRRKDRKQRREERREERQEERQEERSGVGEE